MSDHFVVITKIEADSTDPDDLPEVGDWHIECSDPASCDGWIECDGNHIANAGEDASAGPYQARTDQPWCDEEEFAFHGVMHTWRYGHGWTVPYDPCPVIGFSDTDLPDGIPVELGRYEVDVEWDDESCYLTYELGEGPVSTCTVCLGRPGVCEACS